MPADVPPVLYNGPNAALVNEVIAFALSDKVLASVGPDEVRDDLVIITDVQRAIELAVDQEEESRFAIDPAVLRRMWYADDPALHSPDEDFYRCWADFRENMVPECIWRGRESEWRKKSGHRRRRAIRQ